MMDDFTTYGDVYATADPLTDNSGWSTLGTMSDKPWMVQHKDYYDEIMTWGGKPITSMQKYQSPYQWAKQAYVEAMQAVVPEHLCPHCRRDRHDEPLRERVRVMLSSHTFDPDYDAETDDSPIVCVGSDVFGPNRAAVPTVPTPTMIVQSHLDKMLELLSWPEPWMPEPITVKTWFPDKPPVEKVGWLHPQWKKAGAKFMRLMRPKKESPDVSRLVEQFNKQFDNELKGKKHEGK